MDSKNKNILIGGSVEICGIVKQLSGVYSKKGIKNITIGFKRNNKNWYDTTFDIGRQSFLIDFLNIILFNRKLPNKIVNSTTLRKAFQRFAHSQSITRLIFNFFILPRCSTYIHIWDFTFYDKELFFKDLKRHKVEFRLIIVGSDFMDWPLFMSKFHGNISYKIAYNALKQLTSSTNPNFAAKMALYENYADVIFSAPTLSMHATIKPYYYYILPIDSSIIKFSPNFYKKLKIIHAPSKPLAKGTELIINAIKSLKEKWDNFEFEYVTDIQQNELFEKLSGSDILIDELFAPGPASLAHEAACAGCIVMTHSDLIFMKMDDMLEGKYIHVSPMNVEYNLNELLKEFDADQITFKRKYTDFVRAARNSVEKNNNLEKICNRFIEADKSGPFDFYPAKSCLK
jgi:hypothetical protein